MSRMKYTQCIRQLFMIIDFVIPFVAPYTQYEYRVQAETAVGVGDFSLPTGFSTPQDGNVVHV